MKLVHALLLMLPPLVACGEDVEVERSAPGQLSSGFFDTCYGRSADDFFDASPGEWVISDSPTKYPGTSACPKKWVVDFLPSAPGPTWDVYKTQWADPWQRSRTQCEGGTLQVTVMSRGQSEFLFRSEAQMETPLLWQWDFCLYSSVELRHYVPGPDSLESPVWVLVAVDSHGHNITGFNISPARMDNRTVRILATALSPGGSSTQPVRVMEVRQPDIP